MNVRKIAKNPYLSLVSNFAYALANGVLGLFAHSWWFITVGAYYTVLTVTRFSVLMIRRKADGDYSTEIFAKRLTGILLIFLSWVLVGVNILSLVTERGKNFHEIIMISIATYTFTKITLSIVGMVKARHSSSPVIKTLRNISLADACVSVYSMQRSMLVSFPGLEGKEIFILNICTGTAVWLAVLLLGINLIGGRRTEMAKSKIVQASEKIADAVTDGYKKIEKGVVGGYKKIEKGVVDGYEKIEDKFVETYLTKDGETVEQAKERLKNK